MFPQYVQDPGRQAMFGTGPAVQRSTSEWPRTHPSWKDPGDRGVLGHSGILFFKVQSVGPVRMQSEATSCEAAEGEAGR